VTEHELKVDLVYNIKDYFDIEIEYQVLKTQQKTVQYLDQLSKKIETLKQVQNDEMQSLKDLKASLLDRHFAGSCREAIPLS